MNDEADCRTVPATPGLLIKWYKGHLKEVLGDKEVVKWVRWGYNKIFETQTPKDNHWKIEF